MKESNSSSQVRQQTNPESLSQLLEQLISAKYEDMLSFSGLLDRIYKN
jgi:hypothetical protein